MEAVVGEAAKVEASVTGRAGDPSESLRGSPCGPLAGVGGRDVRVGGRVGLTLSSQFGGEDVDVAMNPSSPELQNIVSAGDAACWSWSVKPRRPGEHALTLTISVYEGDSRDVLAHEWFTLVVSARSSPVHELGRIWHWLTSGMAGLAALLAAAASLATTLVAVRRWAARRRDAGRSDGNVRRGGTRRRRAGRRPADPCCRHARRRPRR
jgi:hypothetical protein